MTNKPTSPPDHVDLLSIEIDKYKNDTSKKEEKKRKLEITDFLNQLGHF